MSGIDPDRIAVQKMLASVPETDQAVVAYADGDAGDVTFRFAGMSAQAAARLLRNIADDLDARLFGVTDENTLQ